jgi:hypothetical protein
MTVKAVGKEERTKNKTMRQKKALFLLWTGILMIVLATFTSCHSPKPTERSSGKSKAVTKDSAAKKIDDGPSEFFQ